MSIVSTATDTETVSAKSDRVPPPLSVSGRREAAGPDYTASLCFAAVPESAGAARRFARAAAAEWLSDGLAEDLDLVVSELITNALLHARDERHDPRSLPIRLELSCSADSLVCRVADHSALPPAPEHAGENSESGRGLLLVDALSADWGWSWGPDGGKVVWARFDLS
jgi:anti-sigma regulatory factor (Ser/Thr protein kinase)